MRRCQLCRSLTLVPQRFGNVLLCCVCYDAREAYQRILQADVWWDERHGFVYGAHGTPLVVLFSSERPAPVEPGTEELNRRRPPLAGEAAL